MSRTGYFSYSMRTVVHCAPGSLIRIPSLFEGLGGQRVVLLSDPGLKAVGLVDQVVEIFNNMASGNSPQLVGVYPEIGADAACETVNAALAYTRSVAADAILAVGGGSVMDAAKGVKYALHHKLADIREALQGGIKLESWPNAQPIDIPHIAVPTTAGTGAEISPGAVFFNEEAGIKCNLAAPFIEADMAVLDAKVTLGLPAGLTASTGMDALTHALEAVASPTANHFTDAHAFAAAQLIEQNLPLAVEDGQNLEARNNMIQGSTMAINAFLGTLNAIPVHNCAHAFGALFHIPHGDANAVLLPIVMESLPELYLPNAERLARALNMPTGNLQGQALLDAVVERIREFQRQVGCATTFSRWQVTSEQLQQVGQAIAADPAALFYPIPADKIREIALKAIG